MKPIRNNLTKLLVLAGMVCAVLPMVVPSVALGYGFRLAVLPKVERSGSPVVHLMWETKL